MRKSISTLKGLLTLIAITISCKGFSQNDPDDGLVLFYPFDMGLLADQSGNGYDGIPVGVLPFTSDSSLVLINDFGEVYVEIPYQALLGLTDFTVSTQVRYITLHYEGTTKNGANGIVSGASESSPYANDFLITYRIWDESFVIVLDNVNYYFTEVTLVENEWYCLSVTRENGILGLYLNGEKHPSQYLTPNVPINISPGGLLIGQEQDCVAGCFDTAQALDGEIDNLRFYNRGFTEVDHIDYCACPEKPVGESCEVISSTNSTNSDIQVSVFPNPTTQAINIKSYNSAIQQVDLVDLTGRVLITQALEITSNQLDINLTNLKPGLYYLRVFTESVIIKQPILKQ